MSECVVRMEMPKSCPCELAGGYDIPLPCFAGHGIPKRCKEFDECVEKGTKPDWCPFVCELPEGHGRLVDADTFSGHMKEYQERIMKWWEQSKTEGPEESYHRADSSLMTVVATKLILDNAPTIVPAERRANDGTDKA